MRFLTKLALLGGAAYAAKWAYDNYVAPDQQSTDNASSTTGEPVRIGYDTPTGTDPNAKYAEPGYEGKSFGQAVNQDQELVDRLVQDNNGDMDEAASEFRDASAGAPALERQERAQE
jgi:hypothetical protein